MPRTMSTHFTERRENEQVPAWSLHPQALVSLVQEDTLQTVEEETWTPIQPQIKPQSTICPARKICWYNGGPDLVEVAN